MKSMAFISILVLLAVMSMPAVAAAETVIRNDVSASASTGGNSASAGVSGDGGVVETGRASASVSVETVVDGEKIQSLSVEVQSSGGTTTVEKKVSTSTADGAVRVETSITAKASAVAATNSRAAAGTAVESRAAEVAGWLAGLFNRFLNLFKYAFSIF